MKKLSPEPRSRCLMLFLTSCFEQEIMFQAPIYAPYKYNDGERWQQLVITASLSLSLSLFFYVPVCIALHLSAHIQHVTLCATPRVDIVWWWPGPGASLVIEMQKADTDTPSKLSHFGALVEIFISLSPFSRKQSLTDISQSLCFLFSNAILVQFKGVRDWN